MTVWQEFSGINPFQFFQNKAGFFSDLHLGIWVLFYPLISKFFCVRFLGSKPSCVFFRVVGPKFVKEVGCFVAGIEGPLGCAQSIQCSQNVDSLGMWTQMFFLFFPQICIGCILRVHGPCMSPSLVCTNSVNHQDWMRLGLWGVSLITGLWACNFLSLPLPFPPTAGMKYSLTAWGRTEKDFSAKSRKVLLIRKWAWRELRKSLFTLQKPAWG